MLRSRTFRRFFFRSLDALGLEKHLASRIRDRHGIVVLNLHRVAPNTNPFYGSLEPHLFDELLDFVTRRFRVTTFAELEREPSLAKDKSPLVLSFDDGHYDFLEHAMPILEKHDVSANQNVIGQCVKSGRAPWNVQLYDFLNACPAALFREIRLPGFALPFPADDFAKQSYGSRLSRYLKNRPRSERELLAAELLALASKVDFAPSRMMSVDELKEVARHHELGSHSYSHESMGFESMDFFKQDLQRSLAFHAEDLGAPATIYAFPNGSYRDEQVEELFNAGIRHALLVDEAIGRDARVVRRLTFSADSKSEVCMQALGWRTQIKEIVGNLKSRVKQ